MANISFTAFQCHDDRRAMTRKDGIHTVLAFSGIHDIETMPLISVGRRLSGGTLSDFGIYAGSEWVWNNDGWLQATGGGAAGTWYPIQYNCDVPMGYVAEFDKRGDRGGFTFTTTSALVGHMLWWTSTHVGISLVDWPDVTTVFSLPLAETGQAHVTVGVWPKSYRSIDSVDDTVVMVWFDGKHLFTQSLPYNEGTGSWSKRLGFMVYEDDVAYFNNLYVEQFHQIVEWTSIDPGELASAALGRVVGYEHLTMLARYDGSVKVWHPITDTTDWTVPLDNVDRITIERMLNAPTHYRVVGALHESDSFDIGDTGHVFDIGQDPDALTEEATILKGDLYHTRRMKEARACTVDTDPMVLLEPEDVIDVDGEDWRVESIDWRAAWAGGQGGGEAPILVSSVYARECEEYD